MPFFQPIVHSVAINRFLRELFLIQNGVAYTCRQSHFVLHQYAISMARLAICSKTQCKMPLNAVRFAAKCEVIWC